MLAQAGRFGHLLFWHRLGLVTAFCLVALAAKSDPLDPFSSGWSASAESKAQMRLIVGAPRGQGRYLAAAEIKLAGPAITYWRAPGDAGVPPTFSFQDSDNVAAAQVAYPAPWRINEQGFETYGYRGAVTFPIAVTARDAAKPVRLRLTLDYAVCDNICLPARSVAELVLPQSGASSDEKLIAQAQSRVPIRLTKDAAAKEIVIAAQPAARQPSWILTWKGTAPVIDLFAEAPDGWDVETHHLPGGRFSIVAVQQPLKGLSPHIPVQFTLTAPLHSYTFTAELDLPAQASTLGTK